LKFGRELFFRAAIGTGLRARSETLECGGLTPLLTARLDAPRFEFQAIDPTTDYSD
jgi:hypothetical protein